jgi:hypothetical protein
VIRPTIAFNFLGGAAPFVYFKSSDCCVTNPNSLRFQISVKEIFLPFFVTFKRAPDFHLRNMSQGSASVTPVKVDPKFAATRREQIAMRAKESLERLKLNLATTSVNLDVIRQYSRARPVESGADSPTKQLEVNLEVEIQGLKRRIQTTKSLLDNLDDEPLASPHPSNDSTRYFY